MPGCDRRRAVSGICKIRTLLRRILVANKQESGEIMMKKSKEKGQAGAVQAKPEEQYKKRFEWQMDCVSYRSCNWL